MLSVPTSFKRRGASRATNASTNRRSLSASRSVLQLSVIVLPRKSGLRCVAFACDERVRARVQSPRFAALLSPPWSGCKRGKTRCAQSAARRPCNRRQWGEDEAGAVRRPVASVPSGINEKCSVRSLRQPHSLPPDRVSHRDSNRRQRWLGANCRRRSFDSLGMCRRPCQGGR